jgi:hypothetical protein
MLHGVCVLNCTLREWGSLWNWEILPLWAYQWPYVDCLSPKVRMEPVSFPQWYRVPVWMGCFPGRTFLVGASVTGKAGHDGHTWAIFLWGDYHHQVIFCPIQHRYETRHWTYRVIIHMVVYFSSFMFPNWHGELKQKNFSWFPGVFHESVTKVPC